MQRWPACHGTTCPSACPPACPPVQFKWNEPEETGGRPITYTLEVSCSGGAGERRRSRAARSYGHPACTPTFLVCNRLTVAATSLMQSPPLPSLLSHTHTHTHTPADEPRARGLAGRAGLPRRLLPAVQRPRACVPRQAPGAGGAVLRARQGSKQRGEGGSEGGGAGLGTAGGRRSAIQHARGARPPPLPGGSCPPPPAPRVWPPPCPCSPSLAGRERVEPFGRVLHPGHGALLGPQRRPLRVGHNRQQHHPGLARAGCQRWHRDRIRGVGGGGGDDESTGGPAGM